MATAKEGFEKVHPVFSVNVPVYPVEKGGYTHNKGNLGIPKALLSKCGKGLSIALEWQENTSGWTNSKGNSPAGFIKCAGFNQEIKTR